MHAQRHSCSSRAFKVAVCTFIAGLSTFALPTRTFGQTSTVPPHPDSRASDSSQPVTTGPTLLALTQFDTGTIRFHREEIPLSEELGEGTIVVSGTFDRSGHPFLLALTPPEKIALISLSGPSPGHLRHLPPLRLETKWLAISTADLTGDRFDDVILIEADSGELRIFAPVLDEKGNVERFDRHSALPSPFGPDTELVGTGDLDGNGTTDLLIRNRTTREMDVTTRAPDESWRSRRLGIMNSDFVELLVGDFTTTPGAELVRYQRTPKNWQVVSLNFGSAPTSPWSQVRSGWGALPEGCTPASALGADFNGDGRSDLLVHCTSVFGYWLVLTDHNEGRAYGVAGIAQRRWTSSAPFAKRPTDLSAGEFTAGDFDGNGEVELVEIPAPNSGHATGTIIRYTPSIPVGTVFPEEDKHRSAEINLPTLCTGYQRSDGGHGTWGRRFLEACPRKSVLIGLDDHGQSHSPVRDQLVGAECCALPRDDILSDSSVSVPETCPPQSVATGFEMHEHVQWLRCTRINDDRFQLGSESSGIHWGVSLSMEDHDAAVEKSQIPIGFRTALGRDGYSTWDQDGCIGSPWGSLLVARGGGACSLHRFRQLQYRGKAGDPPAGTPVEMFPNCISIDNIFSPFPRCVTAATR